MFTKGANTDWVVLLWYQLSKEMLNQKYGRKSHRREKISL
ncbi:hypothetical protein CHCC14437_4276 [Bacillus licheniformis]|nr:hypothetical protein CHCC14437_4276 [Bacillus licheniformis]